MPRRCLILKAEQLILYCHGAGGGAEPFHGAGGGAEPFHGAGGGAEPFHGAGGGAEPFAIITVPFAWVVTADRKPIAPTRTSITARTTKLSLNIVPPKDRCFGSYFIHPDLTGQAMEERICVFGSYPPSQLRLTFAWRIGLSLLHVAIMRREPEGDNSTRVLRWQDYRRGCRKGRGREICSPPGNCGSDPCGEARSALCMACDRRPALRIQRCGMAKHEAMIVRVSGF